MPPVFLDAGGEGLQAVAAAGYERDAGAVLGEPGRVRPRLGVCLGGRPAWRRADGRDGRGGVPAWA